ncbi:MAG: 2-oxoglutarate dehydrogenase E1 component [bacterium]
MQTYLNPLDTSYIEALQEQYRTDPQSLDPTWRYFFDGMTFQSDVSAEKTDRRRPLSREDLEFEMKALQLIQGYREMGYLMADVNPLNRGIHPHPLLELPQYGLKESDLDRTCRIGYVLGFGAISLREILKNLTAYYCSTATVEYGHINDPATRDWIQKRVESNALARPLSLETKKRVLQKLCEAETFETFLHKRFVGQKRFSLEGVDVIIPMLDYLIDQACQMGADEILLGMAHRGRLNVLANIFYKDLNVMLAEFSGNLDANVGDGDVKYHMGFSHTVETPHGKTVHLSLLPNPSHLEAVDPVLTGVARAKQKLKGDRDRTKTLAVLLHGDASFAGQGVVYELLNMSQLKGYTIGGTIHVVLNNQIGFTTTPEESRSAPQATDVAKILEIPIFQVNADEPEPCMQAMELALQFRYVFKRDVVIDLMGYRRYGHNEADEPSFTQPLMMKQIAAHPRVFELYRNRLIGEGSVTKEEVEGMVEDYSSTLEAGLVVSKDFRISPMMHAFGDRWKQMQKVTDKNIFDRAETGVSAERLRKVGEKLVTVPAGFHLHPKIEKLLEERRHMVEGKRPVDWSLAEALSFGTLMQEGHPVRLAGQDSERGTFSHRHAVFHDVETGEKYNPLNPDPDAAVDYEVINSPLSEYAPLGFEFGESLADPNKLTLWEAQFGDFVNVAQVIIDQFIISSAFKWQRYSGLVMLLPHGYEGQGPEHSSGRLYRFLSSCAQNNIQVCSLSTPAQYFHLLRRQLHRPYRLPLILMSPKSLLRHPLVVSPLKDFEQGCFREMIDDPDESLKQKAKRVILCYGKVYYELLEARQKAGIDNIALVRVEQFYPFPKSQWGELLGSYRNAAEIVWCQEGPQNMGGWNFMMPLITPLLQKNQVLRYVGRAPQASPADGYLPLHLKEQKRILTMALGDL